MSNPFGYRHKSIELPIGIPSTKIPQAKRTDCRASLRIFAGEAFRNRAIIGNEDTFNLVGFYAQV